ncbi:opsin-5-like [Solea senegalensis]|uniref:Opsin-5-like n=1 Tax=Solea senegalensis TaxID=28829 RepID=A0AAV6RWE3_SOLSE|nr:opsin 8, group member a isoform X1 [Solea senegalensis]KAG7508427.1 opsin-5-like [Solea senegalensis]
MFITDWTTMDDKYVSKLSPTVDFWAGMYLVIIAVLSILGNAAVLASAAHRLTSLKAPELLTVNLALTDMGMALSMYPLSIASAFNHAWIGGDASCLYYGLMGMIFSVTSIMTLAVMGMIRFLVTGSPPETGLRFQRRTVCVVITGIWLYAVLWALLPLFGWGSYGPEPFGFACSIAWTGYGKSLNHFTFIIAMSILCTFLPSLVIVFTYFGIAWKLHRVYKSIQRNDFQYGNIEKKITFMAVSITLGFLTAWTPYVVVSFWSMFHYQEQDHLDPFIALLPCLFAKSATMYNPFIYFIFRRTAWHKLLHLHRLGLCCSCRVCFPGEEPKMTIKMVDISECTITRDKTLAGVTTGTSEI